MGRMQCAVVLFQDYPNLKDEAAQILLKMLGLGSNVNATIKAATILLQNHQHVEAASSRLLTITKSKHCQYQSSDSIKAATILLQNHQHVKEVVEILLNKATSTDFVSFRIEAATALLENRLHIDQSIDIDPATHILSEIANNKSFPFYTIIKAATALLVGNTKVEATQLWEMLERTRSVSDPRSVSDTVQIATALLKNRQNDYQDQAAKILLDLAENQEFHVDDRIKAAKTLLEEFDNNQKAASVLLNIAENQEFHVDYRINAAEILLRNLPHVSTDIGTSAAQIIVDHGREDLKRAAVEILWSNSKTDIAIQYRIKGIEILLQAPHLSHRSDLLIEELLQIAETQGSGVNNRIKAARIILERHENHSQEKAAKILLDLAENQDFPVDVNDRIKAAETLVQISENSIIKISTQVFKPYFDKAVAVLRTIKDGQNRNNFEEGINESFDEEFEDAIDDSEKNNHAEIPYARENTHCNTEPSDDEDFFDALSTIDAEDTTTTSTRIKSKGGVMVRTTTIGPALLEASLEMHLTESNGSETAEAIETGVAVSRVELNIDKKRESKTLEMLIAELIKSERSDFSLWYRLMQVSKRNADELELLLKLYDDGKGYEAMNNKLIALEAAAELAREEAKEDLVRYVPIVAALSKEDNDGFEEVESFGGGVSFSDAFARVSAAFQEFFGGSEEMDPDVQVSYLVVLGEMLAGSASQFWGAPRGNPNPYDGGGGSGGGINPNAVDNPSLVGGGSFVGNDTYIVLTGVTSFSIDNTTTHFASE